MGTQSISLHLDLDGAWERNSVPFEAVDVKAWGPRLRFSAPSREVENFYREIEPQLAPFLLYGSGDFHYLTALWLRRVREPVTVISFDNHPDWDIRPPRWCCGSWVNRALELPQVKKVSVWGCGNFEPWWPHKIFGNRRAPSEKADWKYIRGPTIARRPRARRGAIVKQDWQRRFLAFAKELNRRICLRHNRSRLPARGGSGDELGKWPFHRGRSGMGVARITQRHARSRGRYLRRFFTAAIRETKTALRFRIRSSEIEPAGAGGDSSDQHRDVEAALAALRSQRALLKSWHLQIALKERRSPGRRGRRHGKGTATERRGYNRV